MCKFVGFLRVLDRPENNAILFRVEKGNIRQGKNAFPTLNIDLKMLRTLSSPQKSEVRDSPPLRQRGRVVSASDSQSGGSEFESRSGHLLNLFSVARVQIFGHAFK